MKKTIGLILVGISVLGIVITCFITLNQKEKFSLEEIYYNEGKFLDANSIEMEQLLEEKKSFLLYSYNNYCSLPIPCETIFETVMKKYKIDVVQLPFAELKKTKLYETVSLAPTIIIIKEGKIIEYLKADQDSDLEKYQDAKAFEKWLKKYINLEKE